MFGSRRRLISVLMLAAVTAMTLDQRDSTHGIFQTMRTSARDAVSPFVDLGDTTFGPVHDFLTGLSNAGSLQSDNVKLRNEVAELKSQLATIDNARADAEAIRKAAGLKSVAEIPDSFANVISPSVSNFEQTVTIDRGSEDKIQVGNPVVAGEGLVGRVIEVTESQSVVRLISDTRQSVGVRLLKAGEVGVSTGTGSGNELKLSFISSQAKFNTGEVVVTAGLSSALFPPGIPVGKVRSQQRSLANPEVTVRLTSMVNLDELDVVRVLRWQPVTDEPPAPTSSTSAVPEEESSSSVSTDGSGA